MRRKDGRKERVSKEGREEEEGMVRNEGERRKEKAYLGKREKGRKEKKKG